MNVERKKSRRQGIKEKRRRRRRKNERQCGRAEIKICISTHFTWATYK